MQGKILNTVTWFTTFNLWPIAQGGILCLKCILEKLSPFVTQQPINDRAGI